MKKIVLILFLLGVNHNGLAQVGVNTSTPQTTLDIIAKNPTGTTTNVDGLLPPKVDRERMQSMTSIPIGTLVYCDNIATGTATGTTVNVTQVGYYFYNATQWETLATQGPQGIQGIQGNVGAQGPIGPAGLTWQGAWASGTSYSVNDAVGYNGASYFCITATSGTTTPDLDTTNWALLASVGATGPQGNTGQGVPTGGTTGQVLAKVNATDYNTQWVNAASVETNKEWAGNETIQFNEIRRILMCNVIVTMVNITAGTRTTAATFTPTEANNWRYIGQANIATIAYPANAIVLNNVQWRSNIDGRIWRRDAVSGQVAATQDATEMAKWQAVTEVSRGWTAGAWIESGQIFNTTINGYTTLIRYNGSAKLATDITNDAGNYETISCFYIGTWAANIGYPKHHIVLYGGSHYKRLAGGKSGATFDADKANWIVIDGNIKEWQPGVRLLDGQIVYRVMGGVLVYMRNNGDRFTATSFTLAECANYSYVSQSSIPTTYPASQVVINGFKFSIGQGGNVYRFNNGSYTTGASFPDTHPVQYVPEGSAAAVSYTPNAGVYNPGTPYTMSVAKSAAGAFEFYEDAEIVFAMNVSDKFMIRSKTTQGVSVWGVEDNVLASQTGITSTNAPVIEGSYASAGTHTANTWIARGNVAILTDYDDFGVYHVAPATSGSFYRITIHGAGANRNYVIERWRMSGVNLNSKVTLGY